MVAAVLTHHPFILQETILKTIQISRQKILIAIVLGVITAAGILLIQNWPFGKESDLDKAKTTAWHLQRQLLQLKTCSRSITGKGKTPGSSEYANKALLQVAN